MDINTVLNIIAALRGDQGNDILLLAEQNFARIESQLGLSQLILQILLNPAQFDTTTRLTASILLKKIIINNWSIEETAIPEEDDAKLSTLQELSQQHVAYATEMESLSKQQKELALEDKLFIKQHLPSLLGDDSLPLRTNIAVSIAIIGTHDFPHAWPELLTGLLSAVQTENPNIVQGALLCFNILLSEVIDTTLHAIVPKLFPTLVTILTASHDPSYLSTLQQQGNHAFISPFRFPSQIRTQAFDLYSSFLKCFSLLEDPGDSRFEKQFHALIKPNLKQIVTICIETILAPLPTNQNTLETGDSELLIYAIPSIARAYRVNTPQHIVELADAMQFECRGSAMKVLTRLVTFFPKTLAAGYDVQNTVLDAVARALSNAMPYYTVNIITPIVQIQNRFPPITLLQGIPSQFLLESNRVSPLYGLPYYMNCCISFLDIMAESTRVFPKFVLNKLEYYLPNLCQLMMLTAQDVETFQYDINAYTVAEGSIDYSRSELFNDENINTGDEDDTELGSTVRGEASTFIVMAINKWSIKGSLLLANTILKMWQQGEAMKDAYAINPAANSHWWKYQEASLIGIGRLLSSTKGFTIPQICNELLPMGHIVEKYLLQALTLDVSGQHHDNEDVMYLQSRGAWLISHTVRHITSDLTTQLHKTKNYVAAQQTYQNVCSLIALLPQPFNLAAKTSLQTQIATAHSIASTQTSLFAIDHSYFMYQCQALSEQFYEQHPVLKKEFDECMAQNIPVPLHKEFVNTIPLHFTSAFANAFPTFLSAFCNLLNEVTDEGIEPIAQGILWVFSFLSNWQDHLYKLQEQYPYIQFFQPLTSDSPYAKKQFLPHLIPHVIIINAEIVQKVFQTLLKVWFENHNNNIVAEVCVDIYQAVASLGNDNILETVAKTSYHPLLTFITQNQSNVQPISKMSMIGPISIILRALSPGAFSSVSSETIFTDKTLYTHKVHTIEELQQKLAQNNRSLTFGPLKVTEYIPMNEVVHNLLPCFLTLGLQSTEKVFVYACCAIISSILAIYNEYLTTQVPKEQVLPLLLQIKQLALLLIKPHIPINPSQNIDPNKAKYTNQLGEVDDDDMPIACRILAQLLVTYQSVLDEASWFELLDIIISKLCTTESYKLKHRCIYLLARVGIQHTKAMVQYLATRGGTITISKIIKKGETKRSQKTGKLITTKDVIQFAQEHTFHRAINIMLQAVPTMYSVYIKKLSLAFLTLMVLDEDCKTALSNLTVDDELITDEQPEVASQGGSIFAEKRKTRSQGAVVEKFSQCNAVVKIIKLLTEIGYDELMIAQRRVDTSDVDGAGFLDHDDEGSDEENSPNRAPILDDDSVHNDSAFRDLYGDFADGVKNGTITLDDLMDQNAAMFDDDDSHDIESDKNDYPESAYDKLFGIEISTFIASYMSKQYNLLQQSNPQSPFLQYAQQLTQEHQQKFTILFHAYNDFIENAAKQ